MLWKLVEWEGGLQTVDIPGGRWRRVRHIWKQERKDGRKDILVPLRVSWVEGLRPSDSDQPRKRWEGSRLDFMIPFSFQSPPHFPHPCSFSKIILMGNCMTYGCCWLPLPEVWDDPFIKKEAFLAFALPVSLMIRTYLRTGYGEWGYLTICLFSK